MRIFSSSYETVVFLADKFTPLVRFWHRRFGHGTTLKGICWCCGQLEG